MQKAKKFDWKDSNMALFGSDEDRKVKKESAETEPAWAEVGECNRPKLFIWRIVKFKVERWPESEYGQFYTGDSYIVLNVYQEAGSDELLYDVHFWIGKYSTQDEYGTAAYKTVELDTFLDDKPVQHREVQDHESALFKSYFKNQITYLKGGAETGFRHVETRVTQPRLFHFFGDKKNVVIKEVKLSRNSLNSGDVYILDLGTTAYQWNGSGANKDEKWKALQYMQQLKQDRFGKTSTETVDEDDSSSMTGDFMQHLPDTEGTKSKKKDQSDAAASKTLYRLSDESGKLEFDKVAEDSFSRSEIQEDDVYIIDNGVSVFVYVGANASESERKNGLTYAHRYLMDSIHPFNPVTVVSSTSKGKSQQEFVANFD